MEKSIPRPVKVNPPKNNRNMMIIGAVAGIAVIIAIVFIVISLNSTNQVAVGKFDSLPQSRLPDGGFVVGNPNAPVTIIEFADYACSHCQEYLPTMNRFIDEYVKTGKAKFEYRIFPTAGGQITEYIGNVLVCMEAQKEGTFWKANELLFREAMAGNYDGNILRNLAGELGVNYADALNCVQNETQVDTDIALGQQLGVTGTPAIRIRNADGTAGPLVLNGQAQNTGGPSFDALSQYMTQFN
ncbi:MAG: DsbA family protein [Chloroflexi bacterium]|nr:DsbA family protein [Chloroflexota bacterium]MCC6893547.1 thioredoxin domain-containing protein [Anaerolineae bacterium]